MLKEDTKNLSKAQ